MDYFINICEKLSSIFNNVFLFKCMYIILAFVSFIPITRLYLGFLTKLILIWGAYLVVNKIMVKRNFDKKSGIIFLFLLLISYSITIALNYRNNLMRNVLNVSYLCINLIVLYGLVEKKKFEEYIDEFQKINFLVIVLSGITSLISILFFIFLIKYKLTVDNMHMNQGFIYNRLYGIYQSANAAGMVAVVSIAVSIINLLINKYIRHKRFRTIYIVNIIVQSIYITLSDSRGALLASVSLFLVVMVLFLKKKVLGKRENINIVNISRYAVYMVLCLIVSIAVLGIVAQTKKAFSYIPDFLGNYIPAIKQRTLLNDDDLIPHKSIADLIRQGAYNKSSKGTSNAGNTSNSLNSGVNNKETVTDESVQIGRDSYELTGNRLTIWTAYIKVWLGRPIFGVANTEILTSNKFNYIKNLNNMDSSELLRSDGNAHNGFIQLLVVGGAAAFLLFAIFWIFMIKKALSSILFSSLEKRRNLIIIITFAIVISLLINNIHESHVILRYADFLGVLTWLYTGYLFSFLHNTEKLEVREVI